jgi:hypothetical protein
MTAHRHVIIRISTGRDGWNVTARARCACGSWRQAGSFSDYPGEAGAIVLASQRFDCGRGPLGSWRIARPFPTDPPSLERAASELDRKSAELRAQAAQLVKQAEEYEAASARLRDDLQALGE